MDASREFRELLAADAALLLGVAEAPDVAAALQRYWARRDQPGATFEVELPPPPRTDPRQVMRTVSGEHSPGAHPGPWKERLTPEFHRPWAA